MNRASNFKFEYIPNPVLLNDEQQEEFDKFKAQYADKPNKYILREMMRVKAQVPQEMVEKHIKNLDLICEMEGFDKERIQPRVDMVKSLLRINMPSQNTIQSAEPIVDSQIFFGGALLLWFLALAAIWRYPYYRTPYYRSPYYRRSY
ncbi:MAG: hypothetical protein N4A57_03045 [Anaeromicrobium sp.]|jgi:hypothetical protein|uniref:hypothetical protein n=1 Tax=Anaeromicrobium sp. TaxID=1929132 RepID=UPI0025DB54D3|nr:hypothetical protein [Anaeromicrobium sp.]MCT4593237.1 hypothetical protein [Anaeromicrobium sp.]